MTTADLLSKNGHNQGTKGRTTFRRHDAIGRAILEIAAKDGLKPGPWIVEKLLEDPRLAERALKLAEAEKTSST